MNRSELVDTLEFVGQALSTSNLAPILTCYCFQPGKVYAFNDELAIQARVEEEDAYAVHGPTFLGLLQASSADDVNIIKDDKEGLIVECGKSIMQIPYFNKADFVFEEPKPDKNDPTWHCDETFLLGLETCLTTASKDRTQMKIMGVCIDGGWLYSCDGDALTKYSLEPSLRNVATSEHPPVLLPIAFCEALLKMPRNRAAKLTATSKWVIAEGGSVTIFGRLLVNLEPFDFEGLIADTLKGTPVCYPVNEELQSALKRAMVLADPMSAATTIKIKANELTLNTRTAMGEVTDVVPFKHPDINATVAPSLMYRALEICNEMAVLPNCTVYRAGENVIQLVANYK